MFKGLSTMLANRHSLIALSFVFFFHALWIEDAYSSVQRYRIPSGTYSISAKAAVRIPATCLDGPRRAAAESINALASGTSSITVRAVTEGGQTLTHSFSDAVSNGWIEATGDGTPTGLRFSVKSPPNGTKDVFLDVAPGGKGVIGETDEDVDSIIKELPSSMSALDKIDEKFSLVREVLSDDAPLIGSFSSWKYALESELRHLAGDDVPDLERHVNAKFREFVEILFGSDGLTNGELVEEYLSDGVIPSVEELRKASSIFGEEIAESAEEIYTKSIAPHNAHLSGLADIFGANSSAHKTYLKELYFSWDSSILKSSEPPDAILASTLRRAAGDAVEDALAEGRIPSEPELQTVMRQAKSAASKFGIPDIEFDSRLQAELLARATVHSELRSTFGDDSSIVREYMELLTRDWDAIDSSFYLSVDAITAQLVPSDIRVVQDRTAAANLFSLRSGTRMTGTEIKTLNRLCGSSLGLPSAALDAFILIKGNDYSGYSLNSTTTSRTVSAIDLPHNIEQTEGKKFIFEDLPDGAAIRSLHESGVRFVRTWDSLVESMAKSRKRKFIITISEELHTTETLFENQDAGALSRAIQMAKEMESDDVILADTPEKLRASLEAISDAETAVLFYHGTESINFPGASMDVFELLDDTDTRVELLTCHSIRLNTRNGAQSLGQIGVDDMLDGISDHVKRSLGSPSSGGSSGGVPDDFWDALMSGNGGRPPFDFVVATRLGFLGVGSVIVLELVTGDDDDEEEEEEEEGSDAEVSQGLRH